MLLKDFQSCQMPLLTLSTELDEISASYPAPLPVVEFFCSLSAKLKWEPSWLLDGSYHEITLVDRRLWDQTFFPIYIAFPNLKLNWTTLIKMGAARKIIKALSLEPFIGGFQTCYAAIIASHFISYPEEMTIILVQTDKYLLLMCVTHHRLLYLKCLESGRLVKLFQITCFQTHL